MNKFKQIVVPEEKKEEIINYFKTEKNNTIKELSLVFGLSVYKIGKIITDYYESKNTMD